MDYETPILFEELSSPTSAELEEIGKFRYKIWNEETEVNNSLFPQEIWLEEIDYYCRHWVVRRKDTKDLLAVARLSVHDKLEENPDGYLWIKHNLQHRVPEPVAHLCKLSVIPTARGFGIASTLNRLRIEAARNSGSKSIIVTASPANAKILERLGFQDTGIRETFQNRPKFEFIAMDLML